MIRKSFTMQNPTLGTRIAFPTVDTTQATTDYDAGVVTIPTTAGGTNVPLGITTPREAWFRNLDDTNYVEIGVQVAATFYPFLRIPPLGWSPATLGVGASDLYARANTAAVDLQYHVEAA